MTTPYEADVCAQSEHLQKLYRQKRVRWARSIGRPYSEDIEHPDPGVIDVVAEEEG